MSESASSVRVNIYGDEYPIRGEADAEYIHRLAKYVDEKMRSISQTAAPRDKLRVAILAAFNIAGELSDAKEEPGSNSLKRLEDCNHKAEELIRKIEQGLKEKK